MNYPSQMSLMKAIFPLIVHSLVHGICAPFVFRTTLAFISILVCPCAINTIGVFGGKEEYMLVCLIYEGTFHSSFHGNN